MFVPSEGGDNQQEENIPDDRSIHPFSQRERALPRKHADEFANAVCVAHKPTTIEKALSGHNSEGWRLAGNAEYQSLMEKETWDLVDLPSGRTAIGCKRIFMAKQGLNGEVERLKARLVAKGYSQNYME